MEKEIGTGYNPIIITGPESTGKTSIASFLAESFQGVYVPEFARDYVLQIERGYTYDDIIYIAKKQKEQYYGALHHLIRKPVIFDTFLIITKIWMQWNSGRYEKWIDGILKKTKNAFYLLCAPDIEWVPDNIRENGGGSRIKLFNLYREELERYGLNYRIIKGTGLIRYENAQIAVSNFLKQ